MYEKGEDDETKRLRQENQKLREKLTETLQKVKEKLSVVGVITASTGNVYYYN